MIHAYVPRGARIERVDLAEGEAPPPEAVWLDMQEPTEPDRRAVDGALGLALPTIEEMREIEASSRFYVEGDAIFMTATVLAKSDAPNPIADAVTLVLTRRALITMRYTDPRPITLYAARLTRQNAATFTAEEVMIGILEAFVDRIADILERCSADLDHISQIIFDDRATTQRRRSGERRDLQIVLKDLGRNEDLASTARESLLSLTRLIRFVGPLLDVMERDKKVTRDQRNRLKTLRSDIGSLNEHASFESGKVNFLLDATLGMISIEQNRIIKLFSVAAVVFLPPTLVASIYGMNFKHMPELDWVFGYPFAIALMILSAILPFVYFRRQGWL